MFFAKLLVPAFPFSNAGHTHHRMSHSHARISHSHARVPHSHARITHGLSVAGISHRLAHTHHLMTFAAEMSGVTFLINKFVVSTELLRSQVSVPT